MTRSAAIPLIALALLSLAGYHVARHSQAEPPLPPPVSPARVPFTDTIAGSGVIEPWTENIALGTHAAGVVQDVCVQVGQHVERGAPLFRIDERQLRADLAVREAMLQAAQVQLDKLEQQPRVEELPGSAARLREAEARFAEEEDRFARSAKLMERRVISEEDYAMRRQALAVARQQLAKAKADDDLLRAGAWEPDKIVARAAVAQARSQVEQTRTELERLTVNAPVAGQVLQVNVRPGEYVAHAAGSQLLILGNIEPLHVRVDIDEADIPRFRPGLPGRGYVRGDTERAVALQFVRVEPYVVPKKSLTGSNTERVDTRVLQAIYAVDATDQALYVGQQLDVFIDLSSIGAGSGGAGSPPLAVK
ncbi:MAG TPA: HlyD family efflux transporter periplasmic adaptor subunit [Planctomycetaceae bacterium]|jgi:multidrug resistance efflux pump|nr:HlyD family efflux transporter periplasmic adaptor subunit [Planctomycetaceae bacterium]